MSKFCVECYVLFTDQMMENILTANFPSMSNVVLVEEHFDRIFLVNYFHSVSKVVLVSPPTVGWTRWLFWELDGRGRSANERINWVLDSRQLQHTSQRVSKIREPHIYLGQH